MQWEKIVHNYEKVYLTKRVSKIDPKIFIRLAPIMGGQLMFRPNHPPENQSAFATQPFSK